MDAEFWVRVAALEGGFLSTGTGWLYVAAVDPWGLRVRRGLDGSGPETRLSRRLVEEAAPLVAAGLPLPPRFRGRAARITALLRAAGVGPGAQAAGPAARAARAAASSARS